MNKVVSMEELVPLIKEQIDNNGEVTFTPKGTSMLPMLRHNKDTVTLGKAESPLKKYQVVFYLRKNGQYVLHRVVKIEKNGYVMRGDNQFFDEPGIEENQIIGVVQGFTRKGREYSCEDFLYLLYCKVWVNTVTIRKWFRRGRRIAGRVKRKILRIFG
ncbi:MAG: hypothetical protein ACLRZ9_10015 [Eubacterium sp.]